MGRMEWFEDIDQSTICLCICIRNLFDHCKLDGIFITFCFCVVAKNWCRSVIAELVFDEWKSCTFFDMR